MTRIALVLSVTVFLFQGLAQADCSARYRRSIDPDQCQQWCEQNPQQSQADPGAYCRELYSNDRSRWWEECGGGPAGDPFPSQRPVTIPPHRPCGATDSCI